jgi:hypothetical protein
VTNIWQAIQDLHHTHKDQRHGSSETAIIEAVYMINLGHAVAQWLWHYVTSRNAEGSRPDEVNDFLQFT